eukprot:jgi/Mesvir1/24883/Mv22111-RA.3
MTQAEFRKSQAALNSRASQALNTEVAEKPRGQHETGRTMAELLKRNDEAFETVQFLTGAVRYWQTKFVEEEAHRELAQARVVDLIVELHRAKARPAALEQLLQDLQARADAAETALAEKEKSLSEKEVALAELRAQRSDQQPRGVAGSAERPVAERYMPSTEGGLLRSGQRGQVAQGERTRKELRAGCDEGDDMVEGTVAERGTGKAGPTVGSYLRAPLDTVWSLLPGRRAADQELLLRCITTQDLGFHDRRPVAACLLFRSMLHWRSFECTVMDEDTIFDKFIVALRSAVEANPDDISVLAYWLSNTLTLLNLMYWTLRTTPNDIKPPQSPPSQSSLNASAAGHALHTEPHHGAGAGIRETLCDRAALAKPVAESCLGGQLIDADWPAFNFQHNLEDIADQLYARMRDTMLREVAQVLPLCFRPKCMPDSEEISPASCSASSSSLAGSDRPSETDDGSIASSGSATEWSSGQGDSVGIDKLVGLYSWTNVVDARLCGPDASVHWCRLIEALLGHLEVLQANCLPVFLVQRLFTRLATFLNVQLFNGLVANRECCSLSNGEYMKAGLERLESWTRDAAPDYVGNCWEELKHVRQAVTFLASKHKAKLSRWADISCKLCPALTPQQLHHIATNYWDDKDGTETLSKEVLAALSKPWMMARDDDCANCTVPMLEDHRADVFLLRIRAEVSTCMPAIGLDGIPVPASLREHRPFQFLMELFR